jgi:flagellar basal-body rod protein FlgC
MSLFNVMNVAGSALAAQSIRLNTTASNMANANSASSSIESTYRARHPVFMTALDESADFGTGFGDAAGVGVEVGGIIESQAPLRRDYQPGHPLADEAGYVFMPNVNVVEEMVNMIETQRAYEMNSKSISAVDGMLKFINNNL